MKRFFSAFLAVAMLAAFAWATPAIAAGEVTFTIGSVAAEPGDSVQVPITVSGNPGISLIQIDITLGAGLEWDYDPALYGSNQSTWPFISSSDVLPLSATRPQGANFTDSTVRLLLQGDGGNATTNGTLVTLKLKVKGDAASGDISVGMSVYSCYNETDAAVPCNPITPGTVTVTGGKPPKEDLPTLNHKVAGAKVGFAEFGQPINFSLTLGTYPKAEKFGGFSDYALTTYVTLSEGLTFDPGSVSVKIDGISFDAGMYTVSTTDIDGATFKVVIPIRSGGEYPANWGNQLENKVKSQEPIVIEYKDALNASATVYNPSTPESFNTSGAVLHYPSDDPTLGKTTNDVVGVYTFRFDATKVDSDNHSKLLPGAVFELRDSATGQAIALTAKGDNAYRIDRNGTSTVTSITTDASGKFTIEGLAAPQSYYLVETQVPNGYVLPTNPATKVQFNAVPASSGTTLASLKMSVNDVQITGFSIMIENGTETGPGTGGMGTVLFTVGGAVLMAAAFVLFMVMRKRRMRGMT